MGGGALSHVVEVEGLVRRFGPVTAVDGICFTIPRGHVLGFIGANGAGKTTTMRCLATLDLPDSGRVRICGEDALLQPSRVRGRIGWMPDAFNPYSHTTVFEYLDFFARAYGFRGLALRQRVAELMEFTDTAPLAERAMDTLSKGMAQRLCLARALVHDPEVLILDEPAAGLDPRARLEFRRLVALLAEAGKTLFVSSHILSELEEMCDSLLFIDEGRILHHGTAETFKARQGPDVLVTVLVAGDTEPLVRWAEMSAGVKLVEVTRRGARLRLESAEPTFVAGRLRAMVGAGVAVTEFRREERRLEEAFVDALDNGHAPENGNPAPQAPPPGDLE